MSVSGHWLLDETSGTSLTDSSGNSLNGTTNGTTSGTSGVTLTTVQTISIPITFDSETSFGVFFFANPDTPLLSQTLFTNDGGDSATSITISLDSSGIPNVNHGNNIISGVEPVSGITHFGYVFDDEGHSQSLYINGTIVSTRSSITNITNNSNTITLGTGFSGTILDIYTYTGSVLPSIVEGLATDSDGLFILPVGTVYGSRVESGGDIVQRDVGFRNDYRVSSNLNSTHKHFVYDPISNTTEESSRLKYAADETQTTGSVNMLVRDGSDMKYSFQAQPEVIAIESSETKASFTPIGLQFNSNDAGIYFGENQEFRIIFDSSSPSRLSFQNYITSTGTYVTKYSVVNK